MGKSMIVTRIMHVLVLLFVCIMGTVVQGALSDGLQSYWQFEDNGNDSQGTVHLTEVNGGSTITYSNGGVSGKAVSIPGVGAGGAFSYMESINAAGDYGITKDFTISLWYKQTASVPTATQYHFAQPDYTGLSVYTGGGDGDGGDTVGRVGSTAKSITISGGFEVANMWQHRVFRVSRLGGTISAWHAPASVEDHGSADESATLFYDPDIDGAIKLMIGQNRNEAIDYLYDEVRIWNRALSDAEIEELFDEGKATILPDPADFMAGLQAYWGFNGNGDDGIGSVHLTEVSGGSTISYVPGLVGEAVSVPGVGVGGDHSYMEDSDPNSDYNIVHEFTISLWYKQTEDIPSGTQYHFGQDSYGELCMYTGGGDGNGVSGFDRDDAGFVSVTTTGPFEAADVWQHQVFRVSRLNHIMDTWYAQASQADHGGAYTPFSIYSSPDIKRSLPLRIAWNRSATCSYLYDEVAVWNRFLGDAEIESLFDMGKANIGILPTCGDTFHRYPDGDVTEDCLVDIADIAEMAAGWLEDNRP